jgi:endonuclease VIII
MPEGDTIWRAARALHEALAGRVVTGFSSPLPAVATVARRLSVVGRRIVSVDSRGKHLLVRFDGGAVLHTHQGMNGSWHLYRSRTGWRRPAHRARAVIETAEAVAVCFDSPRVELLSAAREREHPALARLGPDVLGENFDAEAARRGLRARDSLEIGVALVDQRALSGIGNVYKSEALFLCGVFPFARVAALDDVVLDGLVATATRLMKRNLGTATRRTSSPLAPFRMWVYGRAGRPCRRCGIDVRRRTQGDPPRSTFWCPSCQPEVVTKQSSAGSS